MVVADELELTGTSGVINAVREEIRSAARCDAKVLLSGESGVGKDVVARLIHAGSQRRQHPIVTVNCAALTDTLLETELFGHVRGSFTGALRDRLGALELANRGTVFLDEIGEMTPRMQGLLLRFLETGEIQRVGSERIDSRVNVRVIAATNRDLAAAVSDKSFREDLYYRLNVFRMAIPPLRDRREDIPALFDKFLGTFADRYGVPRPTISPDATALICGYHWPGNVRELRNIAERLVVRQSNGPVEVPDLPRELLTAKGRDSACDVCSAPPRGDVAFERLVRDRETFWTVVHAPFLTHDLTRDDVRCVVRRGLERTAGNYRVLTELFNMPREDYKRFLSFLTKHQCHVAFQPFRTVSVMPDSDSFATSQQRSRAAVWKNTA